ncbi:MAG: M48 family metallopeptidase [Chloroflexi bacterium]|nr:M48 family metallopeptidase [Chloroflexota bacterium]
MPITPNPTNDIDVDFTRYLAQKRQKASPHMVNGVPDYSFGMDNRLRQQLSAVGSLRSAGRIMQATPTSVQEQVNSLGGTPVSLQDYPEIYETGIACSQDLGVGLPHMYVVDSEIRRAYTVAHDNHVPIVVLSSSLVEMLDETETAFVLGHELGHAHNAHGIYNTVGQLVTNPLAASMYQQSSSSGIYKGIVGFLSSLLQGRLRSLMTLWSRCADVTCDRAGLICCGSADAAEEVLLKISSDDTSASQRDSVDKYLARMKNEHANQTKYQKFLENSSHLSGRVEAARLFADCDVLHSWRPEMQTNGRIYQKAEVEEQCAELMGIFDQESLYA